MNRDIFCPPAEPRTSTWFCSRAEPRASKKVLALLCLLTWSLSVPVLAQSKGNSRDHGTSKSDQSRTSAPNKTRDPGPSKSDQRRDSGGKSGSKSRR